MDTASSFTLRKNAKRAAEAMIRKGTAPAVDYAITLSDDGRLEIVWKIAKTAAATDKVEIEIAEASVTSLQLRRRLRPRHSPRQVLRKDRRLAPRRTGSEWYRCPRAPSGACRALRRHPESGRRKPAAARHQISALDRPTASILSKGTLTRYNIGVSGILQPGARRAKPCG
jgi:hypothetical protein